MSMNPTPDPPPSALRAVAAVDQLPKAPEGHWPVQGAKAGKKPAPPVPTRWSAADVMRRGIDINTDRNGAYGQNFRMVAPVMKVLFPHGIPQKLLHSTKWHLFELAIVKITRLAATELTHIDSADDAMVFLAMVAAEVHQEHQDAEADQ